MTYYEVYHHDKVSITLEQIINLEVEPSSYKIGPIGLHGGLLSYQTTELKIKLFFTLQLSF